MEKIIRCGKLFYQWNEDGYADMTEYEVNDDAADEAG